ncbi:MAG: peptide chain release factor N(5)-glutamine methyltransferase [Candidatus Methylopumilus sp.]|jgi:release factor glutamine methyltransferase
MSTSAASIHSALARAQQQLMLALALDSREARSEARILLGHILNKDHAWLITHEHDAMEANIHEGFKALLARRINGEPVAYLLGHREFYGLDLKVSPATLIPRPDTETLVEAALAKIPSDTNYKILDLGTGTGAIALAIARHRPKSMVTAVDASDATLDIAKENAQNLKIANVRFVLSDWLTALHDEKFDVIASNPPYIEQDDVHLSQGDLRFEPLSALASGMDGLDDIRRIIQSAPPHLNPQGWLMLEHGYNQAEAVAKLMTAHGLREVQHRHDLAGIARVTIAQL